MAKSPSEIILEVHALTKDCLEKASVNSVETLTPEVVKEVKARAVKQLENDVPPKLQDILIDGAIKTAVKLELGIDTRGLDPRTPQVNDIINEGLGSGQSKGRG